MLKKILIRNEESKAAKEIEALRLRRLEIAQRLEAFRNALETLMGQKPSRVSIEKFLSLQAERDAQAEAVKIWLSLQNISLEIDPYNAEKAMKIPGEVKAVVSTWLDVMDYRYKSEDPTKYWQNTKQGFQEIEITSQEKAAIAERNKFYVESEEGKEVIETLRRTLAVINFSNRVNNIGNGFNPPKMREQMFYLMPLVKYKKIERGGGAVYFQYEVDEKKFKVDSTDFVAFDEDIEAEEQALALR